MSLVVHKLVLTPPPDGSQGGPPQPQGPQQQQQQPQLPQRTQQQLQQQPSYHARLVVG